MNSRRKDKNTHKVALPMSSDTHHYRKEVAWTSRFLLLELSEEST